MSTDKQTQVQSTVEALRLADEIEWIAAGKAGKETAAELRRQFEEIKRLHALNQELLEALKEIEKLPGMSSANLYARRAIAKAPVAEPHKGASNE